MTWLFLPLLAAQLGFSITVTPRIQLVNPGKAGSLHVRVVVPKDERHRFLCITLSSLDGTDTGSCFPHEGLGAPLSVERDYHHLAVGHYNIYAVLYSDPRTVMSQRATMACIAESAEDCL